MKPPQDRESEALRAKVRARVASALSAPIDALDALLVLRRAQAGDARALAALGAAVAILEATAAARAVAENGDLRRDLTGARAAKGAAAGNATKRAGALMRQRVLSEILEGRPDATIEAARRLLARAGIIASRATVARDLDRLRKK